MSRIEVDIGGLTSAGGHATSAGWQISGLAADAQAVAAAGGGAPPATESALGALAVAWGAGLATLGDEVQAVGTSAGAAAALYTQVDGTAMRPAGG
jgi:hypothetical protein